MDIATEAERKYDLPEAFTAPDTRVVTLRGHGPRWVEVLDRLRPELLAPAA